MTDKPSRCIFWQAPGVRNLMSSYEKYRSFRRFFRAYRRDRLIATDYSYPETPRDWSPSEGPRIIKERLRQDIGAYERLVSSFRQFNDHFRRISITGNPSGDEPYWSNGWLPGPDAASIYALLAINNPAVYFEIGSGNSTKFARRAIRDHDLRTRIVSVDPEPRANIDRLCDEVVRRRCEDCDRSLFATLGESTVMFVDNSHRSLGNSDVTFFFAEILPSLKAGVTWGLHDIFLPDNYPDSWSGRYYNEQYLLLAYLLGGGGPDKVLLPVAFLTSAHCLSNSFTHSVFEDAYFDDVQRSGGCFWMNRQHTYRTASGLNDETRENSTG